MIASDTSDADKAYLAVSVAAQVWLAIYVYMCVRRGFIWLRLEKVEKQKHPTKFKITLRSYIAVEIALATFTIYLLLKNAYTW